MIRLFVVGALLLAFAQPAAAQRTTPQRTTPQRRVPAPPPAPNVWGGSARLNLSAGLQLDAKGSPQTSMLTNYVEAAPVAVSPEEGGAPFFDVGLTVPIRGRVGVNVAFSMLTTKTASAVEAGIPHPFFFDTLRTVAGEATLERREMALHGGLAVLVGRGPFDVVVSGGGSWFRVRQDLVTDVEFGETYPYDTATFVAATLSEAQVSKFGYHAAADFTWRASPVWGIGALVRYSRAEVPLSVDDVETAPVKVGGLQIAATLRLTFPSRRPRPPRRR